MAAAALKICPGPDLSIKAPVKEYGLPILPFRPLNVEHIMETIRLLCLNPCLSVLFWYIYTAYWEEKKGLRLVV